MQSGVISMQSEVKGQSEHIPQPNKAIRAHSTRSPTLRRSSLRSRHSGHVTQVDHAVMFRHLCGVVSQVDSAIV